MSESFQESSGGRSSFDDAEQTFDKMVGKQQKAVGMYVGIGVGIFVLFASMAIFLFWRHSRKRKREINQQPQFTSYQPIGQQTTAPAQQQWQRQGVEVDGLAYKTELEAQPKPQQYQEMNAYPHTNPFQGGHIVEAQSTRDPQEMPQTFGQQAPHEMPGIPGGETVGRWLA